MSNPAQKLEALSSDLGILVAQTTENLRSRGYESIDKLAFQPANYPVSYETYEAIFRAVFAAGEANGRYQLAKKIGDYLNDK